MSSGTLDAYITTTPSSSTSNTKHPPAPISTSQEIRDRGSTFQGTVYAASSLKEAEECISHLKHVVHRSRKATHEIAAFRGMVLKPQATGYGGPDDFEVTSFTWDDGEKWGSSKILSAMAAHSVIDAVVIVSRWYGGTMLGPSRFDHITTCAKEVCIAFRRDEELKEVRSTLGSLDAVLSALRMDLATKKEEQQSSTEIPSTSKITTTATTNKTRDYSTITDVNTGRKLIRAREQSIAFVKQALAKVTNPTAAE